LLRTQFLGRVAPSPADSEEEQIVSSEAEETNENEGASAQVPPLTDFSRAQQAQLAQMVGDTMMRANRLSDAASYFEVARRLENAPATRREIARKIAEIRASQRMQIQNSARQPLLHEALEQDRIVRPRLVAHAAAAPKAASPKGGVKP
jgi:hypothetical protein